MKYLLTMFACLAPLISWAQLNTTYAGKFIATNTIGTHNGFGLNTVIKSDEIDINSFGNSRLVFSQYASGTSQALTENLNLSQQFRNGTWHGLLHASDDVAADQNLYVFGDCWVYGTFNTVSAVAWVTNNVFVTNAVYSIVATNTPDLNPIPETASVNIWSGSSNIFTKSVYLNGPVYVNGSSGGTSNVSTGGITFHFVNGFYTGNSVP